jgi:hypothetical protein
MSKAFLRGETSTERRHTETDREKGDEQRQTE